MTHSLLGDVFEGAKLWPIEDQAALAEAARDIEARRTGVYILSSEERADIEQGIAELDRSGFASDEEAQAMWKHFGL